MFLTTEESSRTIGENERSLRSRLVTWQTNEAKEPRGVVAGSVFDSVGSTGGGTGSLTEP